MRIYTLLAVLALSPRAFAQTEAVAVAAPEPQHAWSFGIAPSVGLTVPTSALGPFVIGGLELDFALPVLDKRLVVALDASLTRPGKSGSGTDARVGGAYDYDLKVTELKLGLDLVFRFFGADRPLVPYLGVGPIVHLLKSTETSTLAPGENSAQGTKYGVEVVGGVDYRLGPGLLLGEVRYVYSALDHLWTGSSNAGSVSLSVGYRLVF
jgi:hypothetical protein